MNYFDLHCDTPFECFKQNQLFSKNNLAVSGEKGSVFEKWNQCFAVWIKDDAPNPFYLYKSILSDFKDKIAQIPDNLTPILTVEGGAVLEENIERLEILKADGIKAITLTWNGQNLLAGGAYSDASLTEYGAEVIKEMNRLNIACDLSHLNDKSFFAALDIADHPLATHSCCRSIVDHKRNLTDEQLKALKQRNGIVGLCFYPDFVGEDVFEGVYRNICHLLELGMENNIAIGSDFDGAKMSSQLDNISKICSLREFLQRKGLQNRILDNIFYNNAEKNFVCL